MKSRESINGYIEGKCYPGKLSKYDVWTRGNVAEAFPDIMTPLSWSLWSDTMNELLRNAFRYYSFYKQVKESCFIMLDNGRLYYNIGLVNHYMEKIGLFSMDAIIGGETAYNLVEKSYKVNWIRFIIHMAGNVRSEKNNLELVQISPKKWNEFVRNYNEWTKINYEAYDIIDLLNFFNDRIEYGKANMYLHTDATTAAFSKMSILQWKLNKYGFSGTDLLNMVMDVNGIEMAKINQTIDELDSMIEGEEERETISACLSSGDWKERLLACGYKNIYDYISTRLIAQYGHRGKNELEIKEKCWFEDPRMLLNLIITRMKEGIAERDKVKSALKIDNPKILPLLENARTYTQLRENNKHYLYYIIADLKRLIRIINHKLCSLVQDIEKDDIYFMEYSELLAVALNPEEFKQLKRKICMRKKKYISFQEEAVVGKSNFPLLTELKGIPACHGIARGRIKILGKNNLEEVNKGDIIVIKTLDISLTPVFAIAGGVITELGGILSHAAIIAREYGIPAVVNVPDATSILKSNDIVILDGNKGLISYDKIDNNR